MMSDITAGEEGDTDGGDGDKGTDMPRSPDKNTDKNPDKNPRQKPRQKHRQKHPTKTQTKTPTIFGENF